MISQKFPNEELLNYLIKSGKINHDDVLEEMRKRERQSILDKHAMNYKIWQGKGDGRWRSHLPDETKDEKRRSIVKTHRIDLENAIVQFYKEQDESIQLAKKTVNTLHSQWLEYKRLHTNAETTIIRLETDWRKFYVGTPIIDIPINQLTKLDLDTWAYGLIRQHNLTKTAYYTLAIIMRQTLDYAVDLGIIQVNPMSLFKIDGRKTFRNVKKKPRETQVFTSVEMDRIVPLAWSDFTDNKRFKHRLAPLCLLFQFESGIRIGEACTLRYEDLINPDTLYVQRMLRRDTNEVIDHVKMNYDGRSIPLTANAKKIIATAKKFQEDNNLPSNGYIFSINNDHLPMKSVSRLYSKYCAKIGCVVKSSHKARKTFISNLVNRGMSPSKVRELVGHTSEKVIFDSYLFDTALDSENKNLFENALNY